jgi:hypothetical protein
MTIKQQGGIFGRNPTFNDVDVEGTLTVAGSPISAGGTMAAQDANAVAITGGNIDSTVIGATTKANVTGSSGVFDDLTVDTNTFFVNATSNQVGIGTNSPSIAKLQINYVAAAEVGMKLIGSNTGLNNALGIYDASANSIVHSINAGTYSIASNGNEALTIYTNRNVSIADGNLIVASGHGIDFSATAGTGTSELFDDYEEGTWTPVVTSGSIAGTGITYSGRYTKIGDTVTVYFQAATTGAVNDLVVASYVGLSGLPFAVASNLTSSGYSTTEDIDRSLGGEANVNGSILYLGACGSGSFTSKISATITYFTS